MSDQKAPNVPNDFEEAERFKRLFIDPSVAAMGQKLEAELRPIVDGQRKLFAQMEEQKIRDNIQDDRLNKLEGSQAKALLGYGVFATGLSVALAASWDWLKSWVRGTPVIVVLLMMTGCSAAVHTPESIDTAMNNTGSKDRITVVTLRGTVGGGSGFVVEDGKVMTAAHVINGIGEAVLHVGPTTLPTTNPAIDAGGKDLGTLDVPGLVGRARLRRPVVGEPVTIHGFIFEPGTRNPVEVIAVGRVIGGPFSVNGEEVFLLQGAAGPGMSGCPVIGKDGAVIGVINGPAGSDTLIRFAPAK